MASELEVGKVLVKKSTGSGNTEIKIENDSASNAAVLTLEGKRTSDNDCAQILIANSGENVAAIKGFRSGANDAGKLEIQTSATGSSGLASRLSIDSSGNVGVGDTTPTSPGGAARFVEISGTSASLVLTDSDAATWEWISAGGNLKAAKDGADKVTIDSSGNVNVNGGGYVKIAPTNTTAGLRLYRNDATINTAGIAIGDINFGGADANNDNAARLRVKSDDAWTSTSSPTAFEFQTCPSGSESLATRLTIGSTGLATFANGITVNDAAGGMAQIQTGGAATLADDASITLSSTINEGALISVHHNTLGAAVLFYVTFASVAQIISDSSSLGSASDTDGKMCMIKTANSHAMTFKNRLGSSVTFKFAQLGGNLV